MLFLTTQTAHFAPMLTLPQGNLTIKKFSDGELYVKLEEDVKNRTVWVIASTLPPAESLMELFFVLDALERAGAHINLVITYFGYARQDRAQPNEALGASVICNFLKTFKVCKTFVIHIHSERIKNFLRFKNEIPLDLFCDPASESDRIAAPDQGAYDFAVAIAKTCGREAVIVTKMRPEHEKVKILGVQDNIENKNILIVDDIISTGRTLLSVGSVLKSMGAKKIFAAATHGIFSDGALNRIQESDSIERVYVTNTLPQVKNFSKIRVMNIVPFIEKIIIENSEDR